MDTDLVESIRTAIGGFEMTEKTAIALRQELDTLISQSGSYTKANITRIQEILHKFDYGDTVGKIDGAMGPNTAKAMLEFTSHDSIAFRNGHIGMAFVNSVITKAPSESVVAFQRELAQNPYAERIAAHISTTTPIARGDRAGVSADDAHLAILQARGLAPMESPVSNRLTTSAAERNRIGIGVHYASEKEKVEYSCSCLSKTFSADNISELQCYLNGQGFHCGRADGILGELTISSTLNFIIANPEALKSISAENLETMMRHAKPEDLASFRERLLQSPEAFDVLKARMEASTDIREKQTIAAAYGFYDENKIDGLDGRNTQAALGKLNALERPVATTPGSLIAADAGASSIVTSALADPLKGRAGMSVSAMVDASRLFDYTREFTSADAKTLYETIDPDIRKDRDAPEFITRLAKLKYRISTDIETLTGGDLAGIPPASRAGTIRSDIGQFETAYENLTADQRTQLEQYMASSRRSAAAFIPRRAAAAPHFT